jgi:hypothetical protein
MTAAPHAGLRVLAGIRYPSERFAPLRAAGTLG